MEDSNPELESFRQQWRAEVSARAKAEGNKASQTSTAGSSKLARKPPAFNRLPSAGASKQLEEDEDHAGPQRVSGFDAQRIEIVEHTEGSKTGSKEPRSALEHYEKAVERETQGSLGDSLDLYRKAFRVSPAKCSRTAKLTKCRRWTIESINNTRTNIFHLPTSLRKFRNQTLQTLLLRSPILPTTP
jgi:hypothetical protein